MKSIMNTKGRFSEHAAKRVRTFALMALGLSLSGCAIGMPGYQQFADGDYQKAHQSFQADYKNSPNSSIAQINMGDSYRQRGEQTQANVYFRQAAYSGKGVRPDGMLESHDSSTTIADIACRHLSEDHQSDANCVVSP